MGTFILYKSAVAPAAFCCTCCSAMASLLHRPTSPAPALGQPYGGSRRHLIWLKTKPKAGYFGPEEDPASLRFMKKGSLRNRSHAQSPAGTFLFPICRFKYPEVLPEPTFELSPVPCIRFWHRLVHSTRTGLTFTLRSRLADASSNHTLDEFG